MRQLWQLLRRWATRAAGALCAFSLGAAAAAAQPAELRTNESDIAAAAQTGTLAIGDPVAVFAYVLGRLPERVQVYPTENYYYFSFLHGGVRYDGNIRLAAASRDKGEVSFAYGERIAEWNDDPFLRHAALGQAQGVTVEKVAPLVYRIALSPALGGKSVIFALNDLSLVRPPPGFLGPDETLIGPSFDESGYRFFLVFNARLKVFHFLLDETVKTPDVLVAAKAGDRILIGKRSGFAFYQYGGRKILVGVSARQSRLNTPYDGPFDQLPENFINGETLRQAIVAAEPRLAGRIDRLGYFPDGLNRYLIHPYLPYREVVDLAVFHRCVTARSVPASARPLCFVVDNEEAERRRPRPRALKRR
jgi:hypothetical protein